MAEVDPTTELEVLGEEEFVDDLSTEFDLAFPIVPAEDDPYPPNEGGDEGLVSDLEEQGDDSQPDVEPDTPADAAQFAEEPAFDWTALEFFSTTTGDPLRVQGEEAMVEWATKAVNTPKGEYAIYSRHYGSELQKLLGQGLESPVLYAEAARTITECLLWHPRITEVEIESIRKGGVNNPDALFIDLSMYIDNEQEPLEMELVV